MLSLSAFRLKASARNALRGNYGKAVLAMLAASAISFGSMLIVSIAEAMFVIAHLVFNEIQNGLTIDEVSLLLSDPSYVNGYMGGYNAINYVLSAILSIFTSVLNIGLYLFCLNLACGRPFRVTDIFHGFRHRFGRSLSLTTVAVLVGQLYSLPYSFLSNLIEQEAWTAVPSAMPILLIGAVFYVPLSLGLSQMYMLALDFPSLSAGEVIKMSFRIMRGHKLHLFRVQLSFLPLMLLSFFTFGIGDIFLAPYMNVTYCFFFLNLMQLRKTTPTTY
ncbi:MAG: DUF975 family protein [Bacteroides sp.]|nr:DUF975 family protein [Bacteroides sp.]